MTTQVPVKKNNGAVFYIGLRSQSNTKLLVTNPTIVAGDFQVSIDGGSFANLATLPSVVPSGGKLVKITLSNAETNGDNILVQCVSGTSIWCERVIELQTAAQQINDLMATSAYTAPDSSTMATNVSTLLTNLATANAALVTEATNVATIITDLNSIISTISSLPANAADNTLLTTVNTTLNSAKTEIDSIYANVNNIVSSATAFSAANLQAISDDVLLRLKNRIATGTD